MEFFGEILIPILIIAGIILHVFAENKKHMKKMFAETPQKPDKQQAPTPLSENNARPAPMPASTPLKKREPSRQQPKQDMPGDNSKRTTREEDKIYSQEEQGEAGNAMDDIRRAVIAHEILKRKF